MTRTWYAPTQWVCQTVGATALVLTMAPALAQSSYTMTTLSTPAWSLGHVATGIDNTGSVVGFQQARNGTIYASPGDFGTLVACPFGCAAYTARSLTWPASTASSVQAQTGTMFMAATHANERGTLLGFTVQLSTRKVTLLPPVTPVPARQYRQIFNGRDSESLVRNGVRSGIYPMVGMGLLPDSTVYGGKSLLYLSTPDGLPEAELPAVLRGDVATRTPLPSPFVSGRYTAMNNQGDAAGWVEQANGVRQPAVWQSGGLMALDLPGALEPLAINANREVLLQSAPPAGRAMVWRNGMVSPIESGTQRVYAMGMNSLGTVVGCLQAPVANPGRSDNQPFIWRQGVLENLSTWLQARGIRLASGTALGCPVAINDAGSILAYTYRVASPDTITWVRLNARP